MEKSEEMKQYTVDALSNEPFSGNPAAVCVMDQWPSEKSMMKLAMENNLSETAFIVKEEKGLPFKMVHTGNGSGIMRACNTASAFVILNYYEPQSDAVTFHTLSGKLTVRKDENLYEMDFPTYELREIPVTDAMERAFGVRPQKAVLGLDLICVFEKEEQVRQMQPTRHF